jgi:hypothetical protein
MGALPAELRVAAWSKLTAGGVNNLELAKSVHKWCVEHILEVFGASKGSPAPEAPAAEAKGKRAKR